MAKKRKPIKRTAVVQVERWVGGYQTYDFFDIDDTKREDCLIEFHALDFEHLWGKLGLRPGQVKKFCVTFEEIID